jgi:hypothetical protein
VERQTWSAKPGAPNLRVGFIIPPRISNLTKSLNPHPSMLISPSRENLHQKGHPMRFIPTSFLLSILVISPLAAEDLNKIFEKVNTYVSEKNYTKALEELAWAKKEIEKMNSGKIVEFFPDEVAGYKGAEVKNSSALGMQNIEREYSKNGSTIKVSLTGGGKDSPMGGLASLGKMAAMFGAQAGGMDQVRVSGKTANLSEETGNSEMTIFLDSGSLLQLTANGPKKTEELKTFAEGLKLDALDSYLEGKAK